MGRELIHNCECYAFEFNSKNNTISIYENYSQWHNDTPAFYFLEVVSFTGVTYEVADKED